jgi:hypothetical protein
MSNKTSVSIRTEENRKLLLLRTALSILFAYGFGSLAVDSGSYWHYLFTAIAIAIAVNALGRLIKDIVANHEKRRK